MWIIDKANPDSDKLNDLLSVEYEPFAVTTDSYSPTIWLRIRKEKLLAVPDKPITRQEPASRKPKGASKAIPTETKE